MNQSNRVSTLTPKAQRVHVLIAQARAEASSAASYLLHYNEELKSSGNAQIAHYHALAMQKKDFDARMELIRRRAIDAMKADLDTFPSLDPISHP